MTLNLVRRSTKGSPLTAVDHDGNLDKIEQAIQGIELTPGTDLGYTPSTRLLSSSTGQDVTLPLVGTDAGLLAGVSFTGPSGWTASGSVANGTITLSLSLPAGSSLVASGDRTAWDMAYAERLRWDGGSTGLNASTARTSLGLGTAATTDASAYAQTNDARLTDSREWSAATIDQAEAEAGTDTTRRAFTAQRVFQAVAAWWAASSAKTKLDGIAAGAQVNVPTDLSYTASSRLLESSTGTDATLPLFATNSSNAGLVPGSSTGGTDNFLRADGTWATPPAGSPGGSNTQLQFNNNGVFGGVSTLTTDGSGNLTFTGQWISSRNGAANTPPLSLTGTWFTGGTATTTKPHFLIEPAGTTSNNWGVFGTGLGLNAPPGYAGNLLDLQVNGTRQFVVGSTGTIGIPTSAGSAVPIGGNGFSNFFGTLALYGGNARVAILQGVGTLGLRIDVGGLWIGANEDLSVQRDAANTLAQRNSTNAQTFRLYNTFTSATNFERLNVRWTANEAIIDTEAGSGGGTLRGLKIGSAGTSLLGFYGATPAVQPTAVADATDASTVITQLNALLSRLRTIGLIAT